MITGAIDLIIGNGIQFFVLLLGLLPTININDLPIQAPEAVQNVLGAVNWFVPIGDLITILTVWIFAVLALNIAIIVIRLFNSVK